MMAQNREALAMQMDDTDLVLVNQLRENGRQTYAELARLVGLSPPAVHDRVAKLEAAGVIVGYSARVDATALGLGVSALVGVLQAAGGEMDSLGAALRAIPEIETCWFVAGEECFQLLVRVADVSELERTIGKINRIDGVSRTRTMVVLSTKWQDRPVDASTASNSA